MGLLKKLFGTSSEKQVKAILPLVDKIEALDGAYSQLTDQQLQAKTPEFKQRLADGETLDDILPEAFAACREAAWRVLGMKPYRVQLIGGIILHQGRIAEMKTGEGKTLVATLPAYLNALAGEGVHIVTVNDYLAKRDSEWMGKVYRFLGLTVGLVIHDIQPKDRKASYAADELHPVGLHAQHPPGGLPAGGEGLGQQVVQRLAAGVARLEFRGLGLELGVGEGSVFLLQRLYLVHNGIDGFQLPLRAGPKELLQKTHI